MSGAIQPIRRPPASLPRTTINMRGFDQKPLGQKALQQTPQYFGPGVPARPAPGAGF